MTVSKYRNRLMHPDIVHAAMVFDMRQCVLAFRLRQFIEAREMLYA